MQCCVQNKKRERVYKVNRSQVPSLYGGSNKDSPSTYSASGRQYYMSGEFLIPHDDKQTLMIASNGEPIITQGATNSMYESGTSTYNPPSPQASPTDFTIDMPRHDDTNSEEIIESDCLPPPPPELLMNTPETVTKVDHDDSVEELPPLIPDNHEALVVVETPSPPCSPQADSRRGDAHK